MSTGGRRPVAFMFPGQGAQFPRMAAGLYDVDAAFTDTMDQVFAAFGDGLRRQWLADGDHGDDGAEFDDVAVAQPLLLGVDCALARTLIARGVEPDVVIGHSVGEVAAAVIAGVLALDEALRWIADLVEWCRRVPAGGMVMVAADPPEVEPYLTDPVVVGAVNGARQIMIAGPDPELEDVRSRLVAAGLTCARVRARQPFHSPAMLVDPSSGVGRPVTGAPRVRMWSAYSGGPLGADQLGDADFWTTQPARPVLFGPTLDRLLSEEGPLDLVEAGPGRSLTMLAQRAAGVARGASSAVATAPGTRRQDDGAAMSAVVARLSGLTAR